jgi:hypothetical protein
MKERGLLARQDEDRNLWAALIMRKRRRVLALKAKKLPVSPELHQHWLEQEYPET